MKTIAILAGLFTGCATVKDIPITVGIDGNYGAYGYSTVEGISIKAKVRQEKSGRISPAEITQRWKP